MKYKLQKTEQIRVNHAVKKFERYKKNDYRQFKKLIEDEKATIAANKIFDKVKTTAIRIENQDLIKKEAKMYNKLTDDLKSSTAKKVNLILIRTVKYRLEKMRCIQQPSEKMNKRDYKLHK